MGMLSQPRIHVGKFTRVPPNTQYLANLQPSKDHMTIGSAGNKLPHRSGVLFHLLEPTEEQEQVSDLDTLEIQVRLRSPCLPEGRQPAILTGKRFSTQIRIEMRWPIR
jgi:hypothetical protein